VLAIQCGRGGNDGMSTQRHCIGQATGWRGLHLGSFTQRPAEAFRTKYPRIFVWIEESTSLSKNSGQKEGNAP